MGERKKIIIPKKFIEKYGKIDAIWSYSKIGTFRQCQYEYYLSRIRKIKGENNIYNVCGTYAHDILEGLYNGYIEYENMCNKFEENFLEVEISDYKFSSDENKNKKMRDKYKFSLMHFFNNHNMVSNKVLTEKEIWVDINGNIFIGYIDAIHKEDDVFIITDYKTSSIEEYKGEKLKEKQKQLLIYALSLKQMGIPLEGIKIRWNFLKYTNVIFKHKVHVTYYKNGNIITSCLNKDNWVEEVKTQLKKDIKEFYKNISKEELKNKLRQCINENSLSSLDKLIQDKYIISDIVKIGDRSTWVKCIRSQLKKDLEKLYEEKWEIELILNDCINENSLSKLPVAVRNNYMLDDCYIYGEVNKINIDNLISEITENINLIKEKGKNEECWGINEIDSKLEFYCNVLCGVKKYCKYYKKYIEELNKESKDDIDLLSELENL